MEVTVQGQVYGIDMFKSKKGDQIPLVKLLLQMGDRLDSYKFFLPKDHVQPKPGPCSVKLGIQPPFGGGFGAEARLLSITPAAAR